MVYEIPKGHLSASSIGDLLMCPKRYEYKYVKGMRVPANRSLSLGSVVHAALESYYKEYLDSKERFTPKELVELTMDDTLPEWFKSHENTLLPNEREDVERAVPDIVEGYAGSVGQFIEPVAVEQELMFESKCGVPIEAHLDLVRAKGGAHSIVDYKVTDKPWSLSRLQGALQFMLYAYITGMPDVQIQNIVAPKAGRGVEMDSSYGKLDAQSSGDYEFSSGRSMKVVGSRFEGFGGWLEDLIESCAKLISSGIFPPSLPSNWWCTEKWCPYWRLCRGRKS